MRGALKLPIKAEATNVEAVTVERVGGKEDRGNGRKVV